MAFSDATGSSPDAGASVEAEAEAVARLAARAAEGDLLAVQTLLRQLLPLVRRVVVGVLGSSNSELDDVIQQALIGIQHALPGFRGECHPHGYATRIALRIAFRARRRHKLEIFRREVFARLAEDEPGTSSPGAEMEAEHRRRVLRDLLEELPEQQAEVLALRVMLGWSLEEVARATGAPLNTVRSRVRLAKEALRRRIESTPEFADLRGRP